MHLNYYTLWYHLIVIYGYLLVAGMAFTAGWVLRIRRAKRKVKEIDGFALYKVAMEKKRNNAKIRIRQEKQQERQRKLFQIFKGY